AVSAALHRRTDGHPLFLVQLVDALLRQGALVEEAGRWGLPGGLAALEATVPERLRPLIGQEVDGARAGQPRGLEAAGGAGGGRGGGGGLGGGGRSGGGGGRRGAGRGVVCGAGAPGAVRAGGGAGRVAGRDPE